MDLSTHSYQTIFIKIQILPKIFIQILAFYHKRAIKNRLLINNLYEYNNKDQELIERVCIYKSSYNIIYHLIDLLIGHKQRKYKYYTQSETALKIMNFLRNPNEQSTKKLQQLLNFLNIIQSLKQSPELICSKITYYQKCQDIDTKQLFRMKMQKICSELRKQYSYIQLIKKIYRAEEQAKNKLHIDYNNQLNESRKNWMNNLESIVNMLGTISKKDEKVTFDKYYKIFNINCVMKLKQLNRMAYKYRLLFTAIKNFDRKTDKSLYQYMNDKNSKDEFQAQQIKVMQSFESRMNKSNHFSNLNLFKSQAQKKQMQLEMIEQSITKMQEVESVQRIQQIYKECYCKLTSMHHKKLFQFYTSSQKQNFTINNLLEQMRNYCQQDYYNISHLIGFVQYDVILNHKMKNNITSIVSKFQQIQNFKAIFKKYQLNFNEQDVTQTFQYLQDLSVLVSKLLSEIYSKSNKNMEQELINSQLSYKSKNKGKNIFQVLTYLKKINSLIRKTSQKPLKQKTPQSPRKVQLQVTPDCPNPAASPPQSSSYVSDQIIVPSERLAQQINIVLEANKSANENMKKEIEYRDQQIATLNWRIDNLNKSLQTQQKKSLDLEAQLERVKKLLETCTPGSHAFIKNQTSNAEIVSKQLEQLKKQLLKKQEQILQKQQQCQLKSQKIRTLEKQNQSYVIKVIEQKQQNKYIVKVNSFTDFGKQRKQGIFCKLAEFFGVQLNLNKIQSQMQQEQADSILPDHLLQCQIKEQLQTWENNYKQQLNKTYKEYKQFYEHYSPFIKQYQQKIAEFRYSLYFYQSKVLKPGIDSKYKKILVDQLQARIMRPIQDLSMVYQMDRLNPTNPHSYIDGIDNWLLLFRLKNGQIVGGYGQEAIRSEKREIHSPNGLLLSLKKQKFYPLISGPKSGKASAYQYNEFYFIIGNSQIRYHIKGNFIENNFGNNFKYFNTGDTKAEFFFGCKDDKIQVETYEMYKLIHK